MLFVGGDFLKDYDRYVCQNCSVFLQKVRDYKTAAQAAVEQIDILKTTNGSSALIADDKSQTQEDVNPQTIPQQPLLESNKLFAPIDQLSPNKALLCMSIKYGEDPAEKRLTEKTNNSVQTGAEQSTKRVCDAQNDTKTDLEVPKLNWIPGVTRDCEVCGKKFAKPSELRTHMVVHTREKPFRCEICDKRFTQQATLVAHRRIHSGEKPFPCDQCLKCFRNQSQLRKHQYVHTDVRPHTCLTCGAAFKKTDQLRSHMIIHTGEKKYKCGQCGKAFAHLSNWHCHQNTHKTTRDFQCSQCPKAFTTRALLKTHEFLHTGLKPWRCDQCGESFARSTYLKSHQQKHLPADSAERVCHVCGDCGQSFKHKHSLTLHRQSHHVTSRPSYSCEHCGIKYTQTSSLRKHLRVKHDVIRPLSIRDFPPQQGETPDPGYLQQNTCSDQRDFHHKKKKTTHYNNGYNAPQGVMDMPHFSHPLQIPTLPFQNQTLQPGQFIESTTLERVYPHVQLATQPPKY